MKKTVLSTVTLMIMSIGIQAENIHTSTDNNVTEDLNRPVNITTVRGVLGGYDLSEHTRGQLRAGYITFSEDGTTRTHGYALAGHTHFDTRIEA